MNGAFSSSMNGALLSSDFIDCIDASLGVVVVFGSNEATDLTGATDDGASFETILGGPSKLKSDEMPVLDLPRILLGVGASRPPFVAAEVASALVLLNLLGLGSDLDLLDLLGLIDSSGDLPARPTPFSPTRLS